MFTQGANAEEAKEAGADIVGMEDLAEQVKKGKMDFDVVIASPDAMRVVGQLGTDSGSSRSDAKPQSWHRNARTWLKRSRMPKRVRFVTVLTKTASSTATLGNVGFEPAPLKENVEALLNDLK